MKTVTGVRCGVQRGDSRAVWGSVDSRSAHVRFRCGTSYGLLRRTGTAAAAAAQEDTRVVVMKVR